MNQGVARLQMAESKVIDNNKSNNSIASFLLSLALFWLNIITIAALSYFFSLPISDFIRNVIIEALLSGVLIFLLAQGKEEELFSFNYKNNILSVFVCYLLGLVFEVMCVFLPSTGWPLVSIFVIISLYSNPLIGMVSGVGFLLGAVLITESSIAVFLLYFISGMIGICMFNKLDERYRVVVPLIVTGLSLLVNQTAEIIIYENATLNIDQFLIPAVNILVTTLIIIIALKIFSSSVIFKTRDTYMEINDPECPLLVELKEKNKDEYYKSIHVAYFCDKVAKKLNLDDQAAKAGGYYQSIGIIKGDRSWSCVEKICNDYKFPDKTCLLLKEYLTGTGYIKEKETGILYFSDAVITTILYLIKNGQDKIDYPQVIDAVFKKKMASPRFAQSGLTIDEIRIMKQLFKDEELYYDFLR